MNPLRNLKILLAAILFTAFTFQSMGADGGMNSDFRVLGRTLLDCSLFGILGILLVTLGFKLFDLIITKIDLQNEVAKGNVAAAILGGAAIIAMGIIVASSIH